MEIQGALGDALGHRDSRQGRHVTNPGTLARLRSYRQCQ